MIQSMTGFGRASFEVEGHGFDVEARSVNHRHLDVRMRLPRPMADQEGAAKLLVKDYVGRGKVDITVSQVEGPNSAGELEIDAVRAEQYVKAARDLGKAHGLESDLDMTSLLSMPGVVHFSEQAPSEVGLTAGLMEGLGVALAGLVAMRSKEGESLAAEFERRLEQISGLVDAFEARSGLVLEAARERLRRRTEQIRQDTGLLDEARLHQEIVIAADRLDITEELVRLRSHVVQFREILAGSDDAKPVGRRLDFLLQEMMREANTVGSKANDAPLAHQVVDLKTELERLREQVQNVA
jgi:uncharacterized protein (TIGR00255 family)